jgi:hypothetical protein
MKSKILIIRGGGPILAFFLLGAPPPWHFSLQNGKGYVCGGIYYAGGGGGHMDGAGNWLQS